MKVRDIVTGNELECENDLVVNSWLANPLRFISTDTQKTEQAIAKSVGRPRKNTENVDIINQDI